MNNKQVKNRIEKILLQDDRIWNKDKTELNQTLLLDLVEKIDEKIIELLLKEKVTREKFFVKVRDVYVFKTNEFKFFMEENKVDNSYTKYKNRIGLTDGKRFLKDSSDVVLDFPFKDCVLEGGQSTEEGTDTYFEYGEEKTKTVKGKKVTEPAGYKEKKAKRKEIFFNQVLAQDEIDRLFDEKALVNWKRYTKEVERKVGEIKRDKNGTIKENLVIKGNNLLAGYSVLSAFRGKVRLVYLDPPYNTSGAANTFSYNNTFNHSAWLSFMKNRIILSHSLLSNKGVIAIAIDNEEVFYLGLLLDELFGRENRLGTIAVVHNPGGRQDDKFFPTAHEYLLVYAKDKTFAKINTLGISEKKLKEYKEADKYGKYKLRGFRRSGSNSRKVDRPKLYYSIYYNPKTGEYSLTSKSNYVEILPIDEKQVARCWRWGKRTFEEKLKKYILTKKTKNGYEIYTKERECDYKGEKAKSFWSKSAYTGQTGTTELKNTFGKKVFSYPKSPFLMKDIISVLTNKDEIIVDIFAGSGTTGVVAHKLGRQYVLIEQLEYIEPILVSRLKKVISGDQSGISTKVNWQGGGSFIYFELAKWNEKAKEEILDCNSLKDLEKLFNTLYEKYFLNYNLKIKEFKEKVIKEDNFKNLSLDEQKRMFLTMLDLNQMYVQKTEMADKKFGISKEDQKMTKEFYGGE